MDELTLAKKVIRQAGKAVLGYYHKNYEIKVRDKEPVTEADKDSNEIIINGLKKTGYGILSEETEDNSSRLLQEKVWIIDPLDGTSDFIKKTDEFCIMIGLVQNNEPILGVVYLPIEDKLYYAEKGNSAFLEAKSGKRKIQVSKTKDFNRMRMLVSRNHLLPLEQKVAKNLDIKTITCGSAGVKICKIASGQAEIYINSSDKTSEWDICAGDIILTEAGGKITDMKGEKIKYNKKSTKNTKGFLVSNKIQHKLLITSI